jgi:hypothetical protein
MLPCTPGVASPCLAIHHARPGVSGTVILREFGSCWWRRYRKVCQSLQALAGPRRSVRCAYSTPWQEDGVAGWVRWDDARLAWVALQGPQPGNGGLQPHARYQQAKLDGGMGKAGGT